MRAQHSNADCLSWIRILQGNVNGIKTSYDTFLVERETSNIIKITIR